VAPAEARPLCAKEHSGRGASPRSALRAARSGSGYSRLRRPSAPRRSAAPAALPGSFSATPSPGTLERRNASSWRARNRRKGPCQRDAGTSVCSARIPCGSLDAMRLWRQGLCAGTQWSACVVQHTDSRALPAYRAILMKPPPKPPQPQPLPDGVSDAAERMPVLLLPCPTHQDGTTQRYRKPLWRSFEQLEND